MQDKVLVAQGGGPTVVINQSLAGVVLEARKFQHIGRIYGARHGVRGIDRRGPGRPDPGDLAQPGDGGADAVLGTGLDPRQARPEILPADLPRAAGARDRLLLLHRRQQFRGHGAHRLRGGRGPRARSCAACTSPRPSTTTWSARPLPRLPVGRPLRGPGLHGRQSRQPGAARRLHRRRHGPPCRLAHRGRGAWGRSSTKTART